MRLRREVVLHQLLNIDCSSVIGCEKVGHICKYLSAVMMVILPCMQNVMANI